MNLRKAGGAISAALLLAFAGESALAQATKIRLEPLVTAINTPLAMVQPPGDSRMFIIEQNGRVKILDGGKLRPAPFLDIRSKIPALHHDFDERGLLGIAFQIQDDILNLSAARDSYGKDPCGDLWEGKHTLILIHALRTAEPESRRRALDILRKPQPAAAQKNGKGLHNGSGCAANGGGSMPRDDATVETSKSEDEVAFLRALIEECGSIPYARTIALTYARRFERDLRLASGSWPQSIHKDFLHDLAKFTIDRTH